ncbi:hypothetical protein JCM16496A_01040 [Bacteroides rodentium JCM 16496]
MRFPYRIDVDGDYLVLFDMASDSMFYHIVRYPDLTYLQSIGKKGSAPNEIMLPTPFQIYENKIVLMDGARPVLYYYTDSIAEQFTLTKSFKVGLNRSVDFVVADDSTVYIEDLSGESRVIKVSHAQKDMMFNIPTEFADRGNAEIAYLWRSFMAYNANLKKIALATQSGDVLEILDLKNETTKVIVGNDGRPRKEGQIEGYHDVRWKNDKIYALYSGRYREDLNRSYEKGRKEPDGGNIIKVFDADGILIKQYRLDSFINGFTFDEKKPSLLIGITSNEDNPILFFDLY